MRNNFSTQLSDPHRCGVVRVLATVMLLLGGAIITGTSDVKGEEEKTWAHATSLGEIPRYQPDFPHFSYVNPDAPRGGTLRMSSIGTFDSLNPVITRGKTPEGLGLIYETLMSTSLDEINSRYGLLAEVLSHPEDFSSVTYRLRPGARWHDGTPLTVDDVIFSFNAYKAHNTIQAQYYKYVDRAEETGEREVTFYFSERGNRELPHIVGQLIVLPKHYWEGTDSAGKSRDITRGSLEVPLGSGPYRIKSISPGSQITYERVPDYWGKNLPVNIGHYNIDEISYVYFKDESVAFEAFKSANIDWWSERIAKNWATSYDFPAVRDGRVIKETFPIRARGIMFGYVFNLTREKFQDRRVRRAFDFAFNFEAMNEALFYNQYERIISYFHGTDLASSGLPSGLELEILKKAEEKFPGALPPEVFDQAYVTPVYTDTNQRTNLRKARALLSDAGWVVNDRGELMHAGTGKRFEVEFLINDQSAARLVSRYQKNLETLGFLVRIRLVDSTQYVNRVREKDFDIVRTGWAQSLSPGNEQNYYWGSEVARDPGGRNYAGIEQPVIDWLVETLIFARDRESLVASTHALDRVLLWNHFLVPNWTTSRERTARWDRFSRPSELPRYGISAFPSIWWVDAAK